MKKIATGVITALSALVITAGIGMLPAANVNAAGDVAIDETNFPDENFRNCILAQDYGADGILTESEIAAVTKIEVKEKEITDIKGIEYFTALQELDCSKNKLTKFDISKNTALTYLDCSGNFDLASLDVSKNTALTILFCQNNSLTELDVTKNTALKYLSFGGGLVASIDVSKNPELVELDCGWSKLTSIDVTHNPKLFSLLCFGNSIKKLDLSNNPELVNLHCTNNELTELDISNNLKLCTFYIEKNKMSTIDISYCPYLMWIYQHPDEIKEDKDFKTIEYWNSYGVIGLDSNTTVIADKSKTKPYPTSAVTATPTPKTAPGSNPTVTPAEGVGLIVDQTTQVICGNSTTINATLKGSSSKISWKSSDTSIATVDASGKVTAKQAGTVTITASAAGKSAACTVSVLYKDVTSKKDFWFEPTNYLSAKGIVKGYDKQTTFKPGNDCTRAQMVTFLWRLAGQPEPKSKTTNFKDIKSSDYFYKPVLWAVDKGITTGVSKTKFAPQGVCTRAQTVTFLWRMANKPAPKTKTNKFKDVKTKDYFYKAVLWASEKKIVAGYGDGTFKPQGKCLRRQMVTFLYKYDKFVNGNA
ncbi:MAG: S-layer homology domain-containing protein [Clostridiales bacterium]|nr:S-layer homology domain-containing protein [Clostridiales bacterium]